MDPVKKAALAVGGVAVLGLGIMGAPLWLSLLGGAGAAVATSKAINAVSNRSA